MLFYMYQQSMVADQGTQYEENPSSNHGGMHEDGLTNRQAGPFPIFPDSGAGNIPLIHELHYYLYGYHYIIN